MHLCLCDCFLVCICVCISTSVYTSFPVCLSGSGSGSVSFPLATISPRDNIPDGARASVRDSQQHWHLPWPSSASCSPTAGETKNQPRRSVIQPLCDCNLALFRLISLYCLANFANQGRFSLLCNTSCIPPSPLLLFQCLSHPIYVFVSCSGLYCMCSCVRQRVDSVPFRSRSRIIIPSPSSHFMPLPATAGLCLRGRQSG